MPKSTQEQEVLIIGDDFVPGAQANSEIDHLLGYNTHMLEDQAIRSEKFGCSHAPDYCSNEKLTRFELNKLGVNPLISPFIDFAKRKKNIEYPPRFVASFIFKSEHHLTQPFKTEELALSCALWYVLAYHF